MKQITQKALSLLLSFAMLLGMVQGIGIVPAFAVTEDSVSIGGVTVADSNWYAKTDNTSGTVKQCTDTDDWNIHVVKDSATPSAPATATVTLNNAKIENPSYSAPAIGAAGYDLKIVLKGTANQIGTGAADDRGNAIYSSTENNVTINGGGDLTLKGYYGINVNGSGTVKIDTTGSLSITSQSQMVSTGGSLTVSAKSITANGYCFQSDGATSLTATDGDISVTGAGDYGIEANNGKVTVAAPKGAVSLSGNRYAIYTGFDGNEVKVSAKNNITMTGTVNGGPVSVASETGNVTVNGYYAAIEGAKTSVAVTAPLGDVTLTSGNTSNIISGSGYTLAVTAHGKLDAKGGYGIVSYTSAAIKADTVRVASTDVGYGFDGGALTITNPEGGNCSEVSVSGGGKGRDAVQSSGDVTVKANQVVIAANIDADPYYGTKAIDATGNVTIGDAGIIVGEFTVGTNHIVAGVVQISQNGGDKSDGLDLKTSTPTQSTYYKAGDGYALFTPASSGTPAKLVLHNAEIHNTANGGNSASDVGIALPAGKITIQAEGTNTVSASCTSDIAGSNTDVTLSGGGILTVGTNGIDLVSTQTALNSFAKDTGTTLNGVVNSYSALDESDPGVTTVYGNVTVKTDDHVVWDLPGTVTVDSGATLIIPVNKVIRFSNSLTNNGTIVNNGTLMLDGNPIINNHSIVNNGEIMLPYNTEVDKIKALTLTGNGSVMINDEGGDSVEKVYADGAIYAYGGEISGDFSPTAPPAKATYYKVGNGYFIFTPVSGNTPASLTLHNVEFYNSLTLPDTPMTLCLEGKNEVDDIFASNAVTVSGSGSLDAYLFRNSDSADKLTVNSGAALNAWYQTRDSSDAYYINTFYGSYTVSDYEGLSVVKDGDLVLTPGAVLTLAEDGYLDFKKDAPLDYMTIGAGASIVNNTYVTLPMGTTKKQIAALPLSGTGVVRVATAYSEDGWATAWDAYTNDGAPLKTVTNGLDLTNGDYSGKKVETDGYAWDDASKTLTLGSVCIEGNLTLPTDVPVTIVTNTQSMIQGQIYFNGDYGDCLTFQGGALLTITDLTANGSPKNSVTVDGAKLEVQNGVDIYGDGNDGSKEVFQLTNGASVTCENGVFCSTVLVSGGSQLTAHGDVAVKAEANGEKGNGGNVSVTGGSTLTTGCNYGVYIVGGKLTVDATSKLITNGSTAPFCVVDKTNGKEPSDVISLPGVPSGMKIVHATGSTGGYGYTYWSLIPANGTLSASDENNDPATLTGAATGTFTFAKPAATVSNVTVTPPTASVQKGNFQTFSAVVTGSNEPSQTVTWSVEGKKSQSTAIDQSGNLTVAADETASTLTVKAVPIDDTTKYGAATVTVTGSGNPSNPSNPSNPGSHSSSTSSAPSLPSVVTAKGNGTGTATVNATADLSGAIFPAGVTGVSLSVAPEAGNTPSTPGNEGVPSDPQGAAVYHLVITQTGLNLIGSPFVYNIKLLDQNNNPITSFTGSVTVKVAVPAGIHGTPHILRYEESTGTFTDMKAAVQNGFLVFSADHFSYYVIAGTGDSIMLDTKSYQMPVNGKYQIGTKLTGSKAASMKVYPDNNKTVTVAKLTNGNYQVTSKNPGTVYIMYDVYDNKNHLLTHASVRVDVKTGIRPKGDSTKQYGIF